MALSRHWPWVRTHWIIEGLWRFMMDNIMFHGYAGAELRALSAFEMALWDLMGKHYDAPLYHLLGGRTRERVPTYNTCVSFGACDDFERWHNDAGGLARSLLDDSISAMKIWPFDRFSERSFGQYISLADIERGLQPVRQIRDAVGEAMEIGIECQFRWKRASIERIARALEPYNILFIEDPMHAVYRRRNPRLLAAYLHPGGWFRAAHDALAVS